MDLWNDIDKIIKVLKTHATKILILDFDGTLTPIVNSPKEAVLSKETKDLLKELSSKKDFYVAIISGRHLNDLKNKVGVKNLIYGGIHGLEGKLLNKKFNFPIPAESLKNIQQLKQKLKKITTGFNGTFIEDKGSLLSFHYRKAQKQSIPAIKLLFNKFIRLYAKGLVKILAGKKVYDIFPNVDWDKGAFANLLINKISLVTKEVPVVLSIGDDKTDEDVFQVLKNGVTIKVGGNRKSAAKYSLKNTKEVFTFLEWINKKL